MVEIALQLGLRLGELLKLRLDSLPRGQQKALLVRRHPDDIYDTRRHEPAVKTAERGLPVSEPLLAMIRHYVTGGPPYGRINGKSPYLFVTDEGQPLSIGRAQDIIQVIGSRSGIEQLSWHRLRHTWAEQLAAYLLETPNGRDQLMYLGGWANPQSPQRYIQDAVAEQAQATLRAWQEALYAPEIEDES
jgi:integrase